MDRVREQMRSLGREHEPPDGVAAFRARPVSVRVPFPAEPVPVVLIRETRIVIVPPAREHHALVRREPALRFRDAKLLRPAVGALGRVRRVRHLAAEFQHAEAIRELRLDATGQALVAMPVKEYATLRNRSLCSLSNVALKAGEAMMLKCSRSRQNCAACVPPCPSYTQKKAKSAVAQLPPKQLAAHDEG